MSVVSQYYYNVSNNEDLSNSTERMVLVGGYGGWIRDSVSYDGYAARSDAWETYDGYNWTSLTNQLIFGSRAWFAMITYHNADPRLDIQATLTDPSPPRMYLFGGGYIGFQSNSQKNVNSMKGYADAYWSVDGANWTMINYEEGGGHSEVSFYSSEKWAETLVDSSTTYLGLWGASIVSFNVSSHDSFPGSLILIGGDYVRSGDFSAKVYQSLPGLFCNTAGVTCSGSGVCGTNGCECNLYYAGYQCSEYTGPISAASSLTSSMIFFFSVMIMIGSILILKT
jgi:hypothetical protein